MAPRTGSLAAQLAELSNVAPKDYDDGLESDSDAMDAGRRTGGNEGGDDSDDNEEDKARSHARHALYDVAPSKMRRQANFIEAVDDEDMAKYQGVKATRKEMLGEEEDDDEEADEEALEGPNLDEEELDDDVEEDGDDDVEEDDDAEDDDDEMEDDDLSDEVSISQASEFDQELEVTEPAISENKMLRFANTEDVQPLSTLVNGSSAKAAQADAALLVSLRQRNRQEAQRGRDARRQMDAWGKLLGVRIRAQKVVRTAGRITTRSMTSVAPALQRDDKEALDSTLASLDQLSAYLFQLQDRLLRSYASTSAESDAVSMALESMQVEINAAVPSTSKKRALDNTDFDRTLVLLDDLHSTVFGPMWREVLAKWSWRTSANGEEDAQKAKNRFDSGTGAANGLKAVNQSAQEQIERGLTGDAFARLRKRTRVWRGSEKEARIGVQVADRSASDDDDVEIGLNGENTKEDVDVFDDSDFYAALLRELIDGKASAGTDVQDGASAAWAQAAKRAAKKHRAVDRKSAKGRRLRYDVHEKVENFMPPVPTETWSAEQIHRLVQQLRSGHGFADVPQPQQEDDIDGRATLAPHMSETASTVEMGGLRLFG